jgi:hypothetical protein
MAMDGLLMILRCLMRSRSRALGRILMRMRDFRHGRMNADAKDLGIFAAAYNHHIALELIHASPGLFLLHLAAPNEKEEEPFRQRENGKHREAKRRAPKPV